MSKVLLLSCSQRKRTDATNLPAISRYDGNAFRVLRRYTQNSTENLAVYIISAKYGLIKHDKRIPYYDRLMTAQRAHELKPQIAGRLSFFFKSELHQANKKLQLLVCMSKLYLEALPSTDELRAYAPEIKIAEGPPGKKLAALHDWLYDEASTLRNQPAAKPKGVAQIRGVQIKLTKREAFELARRTLADETQTAHHSYQSWYVPVNGRRVSPKRLVSQLTDLPVSSFHTDEARRVLRELGIEVVRV